MSAEVEAFARWLSDATDRPVTFQDERYTSREAAGLMRPAQLTRGRKKARHDAVAAQVILSNWLERQAAGLPATASEPGEALDD
jgi:putative Holliday junction resolvase